MSISSQVQRHEPTVLSVLLWLGGVPPMLSGVVAAFAPDTYLAFGGADGLLTRAGLSVASVILSLQGGDAFVAGAGRVAAAVWGNVMLKRVMAAIAIPHGIFEIWLLPTRLLGLYETHPGAAPDAMLSTVVWGFVALHIVLVLGTGTALGTVAVGSRRNNRDDE